MLSSLAHANMTCGGAIRLANKDARTITEAMNTLPVTAKIVHLWIDRDGHNLGNIKLACDENDSLEALCNEMPKLVEARSPGLIWNISATDAEKEKLTVRNKALRARLAKICK